MQWPTTDAWAPDIVQTTVLIKYDGSISLIGTKEIRMNYTKGL